LNHAEIELMQSKEYQQPLFEITTPLGFTVRTSREYWNKLVAKHPDIAEKLDDVKRTLKQPSEIRQSSQDEFVFLFYSPLERHWLTVVARRIEESGFLITCYRTDKIKEGTKIWPK
jgi:hypothetical protein